MLALNVRPAARAHGEPHRAAAVGRCVARLHRRVAQPRLGARPRGTERVDGRASDAEDRALRAMAVGGELRDAAFASLEVDERVDSLLCEVDSDGIVREVLIKPPPRRRPARFERRGRPYFLPQLPPRLVSSPTSSRGDSTRFWTVPTCLTIMRGRLRPHRREECAGRGAYNARSTQSAAWSDAASEAFVTSSMCGNRSPFFPAQMPERLTPAASTDSKREGDNRM